jgi:hypothetical protein
MVEIVATDDALVRHDEGKATWRTWARPPQMHTDLFCNPYETEGMTYDEATEALQHAAANPSDQARLIRLRQYGGNAPMLPQTMGS